MQNRLARSADPTQLQPRHSNTFGNSLFGQPIARSTQTARASVPARSAFSFVDSIGVNTHLNVANSVYENRYSEVRSKLAALGVRHIRDGGSIDKMKDLAKLGIKTTFILNPIDGSIPNKSYWGNPNSIPINTLVGKVGNKVIDAVEISNEIDLFYTRGYYWHPKDTTRINNDSNSPFYWGKYVRALTQDTWAALKNNPATRNTLVFGPSLVQTESYSAVGDLTSSIDASNVHWYMAGRNPETSGWGGPEGYGSRQWQINYKLRYQSPTKPFVATEGGYSNAVNQTKDSPPEVTTGRYLPRLFFHAFQGGFKRFFMYDFIDDAPNPQRNDYEANFGLLRNDLSEKPAYTALKNIIGVLKDGSGTFKTKPLAVSLKGKTANVQQCLLQKRDGTYYLATWLGVPSYDPTTGQSIAVSSRAVKLTLPNTIKSARVYTLSDSGAMSQASAPIKGGKIGLSVSDRVTIVKLTPKG